MNRVLLLVLFSCLCTFLVDARRPQRRQRFRQIAATPGCEDSWTNACPTLAKIGLCNGAYREHMARYCPKSCPQLCKREPWFQIHSSGYNKCLTLFWKVSYRREGYVRIKIYSPALHIARCQKQYNRQLWKWTSSGQLQIKATKQCLTLSRLGHSVSMTTCNSYSAYQKWECQGNWIKLRSYSKYLVPIKFSGYNYITIRTYVTANCKWVDYESRRSICERGVVTTSKPTSTPPPPTRVKTPPRPTTPPTTPPTTQAPTTTQVPPPVPPTAGVITPPLPVTPPIPGNTPPVPPIPTALKPPPPPSNQNVTCGTKPILGQVINGTAARVGSWPWHIGIRTCANCQISCGGTLINDEWVVTAAHCVTSWVAEDLFLVAGEIDQATLSGNEQHFKCKQIIIHEQYEADAPFDKDVALLQLDKYAVYNDHVRPLCLPDSGTVLKDQDRCTITGFGSTSESGPKSSELLQANVKIVSRTKCKAAYLKLSPPRLVTNNMVCAGFDRGGTDACQGDSGGPLTCFHLGSFKFTLGGIVSWGVGCAKANQYGVYTNVPLFTSWIKQKLPSM